MICPHMNFMADVDVARITSDDGVVYRYSADVKVKCNDCGLPFRFVGLPVGLDFNSPTVNVDATEARLPLAPKGEVLSELEGTPIGFSIRKVQ